MVSDMTQQATAELDVERSLSPPNEQLSCHWEIGKSIQKVVSQEQRHLCLFHSFAFAVFALATKAT